MTVADVNADGKLDLAMIGGDHLTVLLGTGTGGFSLGGSFHTGIGPNDIAIADIDGDGRQDLAITNGTANTVSILLGTGTGSFGPKTDFATGTTPNSVAISDFNGDGKPDLAVTNSNDSTVSIFLQACSGDSDCDGVLDASDNCPNTPNPGQANNDAAVAFPWIKDGNGTEGATLGGDVCDANNDNVVNAGDLNRRHGWRAGWSRRPRAGR